MASTHDTAFGSAAVKQRVLTSEQVILGGKVQKILDELGISKPLAVVAVEAGWIELDEAFRIVTGLRKLGIDHPEVKPREASDADESVLERLSPAARKRLETASRTLASLFYARGAGTLALDQGAATPTTSRKAATPTPAPARRVKPVVAPVQIPPRKSGALGAILAVTAALAAIIAFAVFKKGKPTVEVEPPFTVQHPPPPAPKIPPPPPPKAPPPPPPDTTPDTTPDEPTSDAGVDERRKKYIEEQEREAARMLDEIKKLLEEGRPASARGRLKQLSMNYGWTEYVKSRAEEIARLTKAAEGDSGVSMPDPTPDPGPDTSGEGPALPGLAAALKRLDENASADSRRAASAKTRLAGQKSDLVLRGGKIVKGAEVVDITREDLRVRGEIDGVKVDFLLAWSALDAASFISLQKQIWKGQGAAGYFELGRAAVQRRLWKDAKAAFDECAKADPAWKPRLPDITAVLSDPAILHGAARRMGDGRLCVEYSFADAEQAGDFVPASGSGTAAVAGGTLKLSGLDAFWSLKDLVFNGDIDLYFVFEGPGEIAVAFGGKAPLLLGSSGVKAAAGVPLKVERRGKNILVIQDGRVLGGAENAAAEGPQKLLVGAKGEAAIKNLFIAGAADDAEMAKRLGPLERLEGGAHAGDFRLEPVAMDAEAASRAALAESALEAGQLEEAWGLAEDAVAKSPAGGLAVAVRGLIRLAQGETRLAIADADLALALDPCRGEVAIRARRILTSLRGPSAIGAHRRLEIGPWDVRSDAAEERMKFFAGKLDEASKRFAEAMKEAGPAPKGVRAAVFASREACFAYLEMSDGREAAVVDAPGAEKELIRLAAGAYLRAVVTGSPAWFEEGMAAHLSGEIRAAEMKTLLPQAVPLDALLKKSAANFTESDRVQSASVVRFFLSGAHKAIIPDLLKKLKHGVPAIEAFSGKSLPTLDAEWRKWAAADEGK
jgi:tetratricopeptide (TPR) repeat protein